MPDPRTAPTHRAEPADRDRPARWFRWLVVVSIAVVVAAPLVGMRSLLFSLTQRSHPHTVIADNQLDPSQPAGVGQFAPVPTHRPSRSPSASPSASASVTPSPRPRHGRKPAPSNAPTGGGSAPRNGAAITANYSSTSSWGSGFDGEVDVSNSGGSSGSWTVVITLPRGATITDQWGDADYEQDGRTVTFTPTDGDLTPGGDVTFDFQVEGANQPSSCSVNGDACD